MNTLVLCFLIIIVRVIETSMATVRMIFTIKNKKAIATFIAFIEILIWFLIVKEAIKAEENSILIALSYAIGFALGTYIGMIINEKRIPTNLMLTIIVNKNRESIFKMLMNNKFAFSTLKAKGRDLKTNRDIIFIVTTSKRIKKLEKLLLEYDDKIFIITNEPKQIFNGFFNL